MSGQLKWGTRNSDSGMLKQFKEQCTTSDCRIQGHGPQSYYLSQFLNNPPKWKSSHSQTRMLRRMQSRNWLLIGFDNTIFAAKVVFFTLAGYTEKSLAGLLTAQQARTFSVYATAMLIAILTLAVCREINMFCFRSVGPNENTASAPPSVAETKSMISTTHQNLFLTRLRSLI